MYSISGFNVKATQSAIKILDIDQNHISHFMHAVSMTKLTKALGYMLNWKIISSIYISNKDFLTEEMSGK